MSKAGRLSLFISHWHARLDGFPRGALWNFNWHHSELSFNVNIVGDLQRPRSLPPLTPTRHFKGALLSIPQSCIKHVNLGDMLTTRLRVLPNSNEDSDHLGREGAIGAVASARWSVRLPLPPRPRCSLFQAAVSRKTLDVLGKNFSAAVLARCDGCKQTSSSTTLNFLACCLLCLRWEAAAVGSGKPPPPPWVPVCWREVMSVFS